MKPHTLPVKRRPVPKGVFKRLSAVTRQRKQRVAAATAAAEQGHEDHSSKISRALTIIFLIHIVAIGLIFFHQRFLDRNDVGAPEGEPAAAETARPEAKKEKLPILSSGERSYLAKPGDNYARIAAALEVDEAELRALNNAMPIRTGVILKAPPKRIVAVDPPEVAAIRNNTPADRERGLVEATPVNAEVETAPIPRAILVQPKARPEAAPAPAASGRTYVVQSGDSVWRIANRFKVDQDALMRANGITDARKLKLGMKLVIPK